ncbi:hypothetical protein ACJQWK_10079 [Exserohilum turcicum]
MSPVVQRAHTVKKLLEEDIAGLKPYSAPHSECAVEFQLATSARSLSNDDMQACLDLVEQTSGADYRASSIGWNTRKKREEMLDSEMLYLLVRQSGAETVCSATQDVHTTTAAAAAGSKAALLPRRETKKRKRTPDADAVEPVRVPPRPQQPDELEQLAEGYCASDTDDTAAPSNATCSPNPSTKRPILGFLSFMFTWDDPPYTDREVVYIYEIHLAPQLRSRGLGSRLVAFAEAAARACGIDKAMLTVFTANARAKAMYERLGYQKDACSPADRMVRSKVIRADYAVMSKIVGKYVSSGD